MSDNQNYVQCGICGYPYASHWYDDNGEAIYSCPLCGYFENVTEYNPDYFDSEKEYRAAQNRINKLKPKIPTDKKISIAKEIVKVVDIIDRVNPMYNNYDVLELYKDFIENEPKYTSLENFFAIFENEVKMPIKRITIESIFEL